MCCPVKVHHIYTHIYICVCVSVCVIYKYTVYEQPSGRTHTPGKYISNVTFLLGKSGVALPSVTVFVLPCNPGTQCTA